MIYRSIRAFFLYSLLLTTLSGCKKNSSLKVPDISCSFTVDGIYNGSLNYAVGSRPVIKINFTGAVNKSSAATGGIKLMDASSNSLPFTTVAENGDKTLVITPQANLPSFAKYTLQISNALLAANGGQLINPLIINLNTGLDNMDKFPRISDEELLTLVQQKTFKYFYDFGHPASGMARERNTSGNTVTTGGSGFGIMALVTGVNRNFISREEGLARLQKIVGFLKNKASRFHGAYPHWMDGNTGAVIPFSTKDNGGDLVETSLLMQGLITARQYFSGNDAAETALRSDITNIYNGVEWDWYRKDNSEVLYWHWSPQYNWDLNLPIKGWNECLITYVLAASSTTHPIPKAVYDKGWAQNGAMKFNNNAPLFFAHYSFLGINPNELVDAYGNYGIQNRAHSLANYQYCVSNPKQYAGYGENCWGLTASDIPNGYTASAPANDRGVIAPTAAISSMPYTPAESMQALRFFYYKLGDQLFKDYGFVDAFSLQEQWFASSTLAIDQGPIIIMIENYRSKLLWNLFMSAPEVKTGMKSLGFSSPNL